MTTPANEKPGSSSRSTIWVLSLLTASLTSGYGVMFTVLGEYRMLYGLSETSIGFLVGAGFIASFAAQLILSPLADRGDTTHYIRLAVVAYVVGLVFLGFGTSFLTLLFGRLLSGTAIGAALPAIRRMAILADSTKVERNLAALTAADIFGFAAGPAISALTVSSFGISTPYVLVAGLSLTAVVGLRFVPMSLLRRAPNELASPRLSLVRDRYLVGNLLLGGAFFAMVGAFDTLWDLVHADLGTAPWLANLGISLFAIPVIVMAPLGARLAERHGPTRVAFWGLMAAAFFLVSYGVAPTGEILIAIVLIQAITDGLTIASPGIAVAAAAPEEHQAAAQGLLGATQAIAAGLVATAAGALYGEYGRAVAYNSAAALVVAAAAIGFAVASSRSSSPSSRNTVDGV